MLAVLRGRSEASISRYYSKLLKTAAHAASIGPVTRYDSKKNALILQMPGESRTLSRIWAPLSNRSDAMDLVIRLKLSLEVHNDTGQSLPWLRVVDRQCDWTHVSPKDFLENQEANTLLAITIAASKAKPEKLS